MNFFKKTEKNITSSKGSIGDKKGSNGYASGCNKLKEPKPERDGERERNREREHYIKY